MELKDRELYLVWIQTLLVECAGERTAPISESLMKCAATHYQSMNMESVLRPLRGNLPGLIDMLQTGWGWIVSHDHHARTIVADENKPTCVCPLFREGLVDSSLLCDCSRGFASRMFEFVLDHPVQTTIVQSVLRGANSCICRIDY